MRIWRELSSFIRHPKAKMLLLVTTSVATGILEAGVLVCVVRLALALDSDGIGSLTIGGITQSGRAWFAVVTLALLMIIALHVAFASLVSRLSAEVLESIRRSLVESFMAASWHQQSSESDGGLIHSASSLALQSAHLTLLAGIGAASAINLAVLLFVAALIDWIIVVALAVAGTTLFFALRPIARHTRSASRDFVDTNARFSNILAMTERISYESRVFGVEEEATRRTLEANHQSATEFGRSRFNSLYGASLYRDIALLLLVGCLAAVAAIGDADIAKTGAVVLVAVRAISYAQGVQNARQAVIEQAPNLHAAVADLDRLRATHVDDGAETVTSIGNVEFSDVSFGYPSRPPVLDRFNLTITQGEAVGLAGPSGAGKSTVAKLLLRTHEPTAGAIRIDGRNLQDLRQHSWTNLVAAVPQEVRLFDGTIADNVRILRDRLSDERVREALARANVLDEIEALPDGILTEVGPSGVGLSGGQRQRVAIARALVGDPQLLIMDEPTSALDEESDQLITEVINSLKGSVTLLLVAHRATTLSICDRVVWLGEASSSQLGNASTPT